MSPLTNPEDADEATRVINSYAESDWCDISYSQHARERIKQRIIPSDVITDTLKTGSVVEIESEVTKANRLRYTYKVEMTDKYGRVTVITAIPGSLKLHIVSAYTDIPDN